jgi:hypothetical protein
MKGTSNYVYLHEVLGIHLNMLTNYMAVQFRYIR